MATHTVQTDNKGRICLGTRYASSLFLVEESAEGEFVLRKAVPIPERELWLHQNEKAKEAVLEGISQAKAGRLTRNAVKLPEILD